jgi:hypothetical protein
MIRIFLLSLLFFSCASQSLEEYQSEGDAIQRAIVEELTCVHRLEELRRSVPRLRHQFNKLVSVIIEARERFPYSHVQASSGPGSDRLRLELLRLYELEGAREVMEGAQREALTRLDRFESERVARLPEGLASQF